MIKNKNIIYIGILLIGILLSWNMGFLGALIDLDTSYELKCGDEQLFTEDFSTFFDFNEGYEFYVFAESIFNCKSYGDMLLDFKYYLVSEETEIFLENGLYTLACDEYLPFEVQYIYPLVFNFSKDLTTVDIYISDGFDDINKELIYSQIPISGSNFRLVVRTSAYLNNCEEEDYINYLHRIVESDVKKSTPSLILEDSLECRFLNSNELQSCYPESNGVGCSGIESCEASVTYYAQDYPEKNILSDIGKEITWYSTCGDKNIIIGEHPNYIEFDCSKTIVSASGGSGYIDRGLLSSESVIDFFCCKHTSKYKTEFKTMNQQSYCLSTGGEMVIQSECDYSVTNYPLWIYLIAFLVLFIIYKEIDLRTKKNRKV